MENSGGQHALKYLNQEDGKSAAERNSKGSSTTKSKRNSGMYNKIKELSDEEDAEDLNELEKEAADLNLSGCDLAWTKYELRISKGGYDNATENELADMLMSETGLDLSLTNDMER